MATFSKEYLSASSNGLCVAVAATSSPGTTIHTTGASAKDEVILYATNIYTGALNLTIEWGTTGATNSITQSIPASSGLTIVIPGLVLSNSQTVKAYSTIASKILIFGFVNRIT